MGSILWRRLERARSLALRTTELAATRGRRRRDWTQPSSASRPASVILMRTASNFKRPSPRLSGRAVASPSPTRSSSSGVNRARNNESARPRGPEAASSLSARRFLRLIMGPTLESIASSQQSQPPACALMCTPAVVGRRAVILPRGKSPRRLLTDRTATARTAGEMRRPVSRGGGG